MRCLHATLATFEDTTLFAPPPRAGGLDYVRNGLCVLVRFFLGGVLLLGLKLHTYLDEHGIGAAAL